MILVDAHCHLEPHDFSDVPGVVERAKAAGLVHAVVVGQFHAPGDFGHAIDVAASAPDFFSATLGIHPHEAQNATEADFEFLEATCATSAVKAVGEAGLDYYYYKSPADVQRRVFSRQCALARNLKKPLVVHVRDAHDECFDIIRAENVERGVIHCFTGDEAAARKYLELGFYLSISGIITYKKTEALVAAVKMAPMERLMIETDSPFLAPVPHRGRKNEPAFVAEVARRVSEIKGIPVEEVALTAARNSVALFGLPVSL